MFISYIILVRMIFFSLNPNTFQDFMGSDFFLLPASILLILYILPYLFSEGLKQFHTSQKLELLSKALCTQQIIISQDRPTQTTRPKINF